MKIRGNNYPEPKRITISVFLGTLFLFFAAFIYIALRPNEPVFFSWINYLGLNEWLSGIQNLSFFKNLSLPEWIIYSLPNGFWAFSYAVFIISIWRTSKSFVKYFWIFSIPTLVFGYELLQINQVLPGTFCWLDITAGLLGIALGAILAGFPVNTKSFINSNFKTK